MATTDLLSITSTEPFHTLALQSCNTDERKEVNR